MTLIDLPPAFPVEALPVRVVRRVDPVEYTESLEPPTTLGVLRPPPKADIIVPKYLNQSSKLLAFLITRKNFETIDQYKTTTGIFTTAHL